MREIVKIINPQNSLPVLDLTCAVHSSITCTISYNFVKICATTLSFYLTDWVKSVGTKITLHQNWYKRNARRWKQNENVFFSTSSHNFSWNGFAFIFYVPTFYQLDQEDPWLYGKSNMKATQGHLCLGKICK